MSTDDRKQMHESPPMYRRKQLLARMAGNIAAGLALAWTTERLTGSLDEVADHSVDIAERILRRVGL